MNGHDNNMKEVYFSEYCKTCKNEKLNESEDPCNECLGEGGRENSHKPSRWEEK